MYSVCTYMCVCFISTCDDTVCVCVCAPRAPYLVAGGEVVGGIAPPQERPSAVVSSHRQHA